MTGKQQLDDLDAVRQIIQALSGFDPGEQERILRWAREKVGLAPGTATGGVAVVPAAPPILEHHGPGSKPSTNIKTFIESKKPASDNQFAAAVAYFYRFEAPEHLRKDTITKDDLLDACRQVGRNRVAAPAQTLVNAHSQGLLDRADKGAYSINTVGENLVAVALPSDGGVRVARRAKPRKKAASAKKPARKVPRTSPGKQAGAAKRGR